MKKTIAIAGIAAAASAGLLVLDEAAHAEEKQPVITDTASEQQAMEMTSTSPIAENQEAEEGDSQGSKQEANQEPGTGIQPGTESQPAVPGESGPAADNGTDSENKVSEIETENKGQENLNPAPEASADASGKNEGPALSQDQMIKVPNTILTQKPLETPVQETTVQEDNKLELNGWNEDQTSYYENGKFLTGIHEIDGKKYHFSDEGQKTSNKFIDLKDLAETTKTVYFDVDGAMVYGQKKIDNHWYCFELGTGYMFTGLTNLSTAYQPNGAKTVYYNKQGQMEYGEIYENGNWRYFDTYDGHMVTNQEVFVEKSKDNDEKPATYYFGKDGKKIYGEKQTAPGIWKLYKKDNGARVEGFFRLTKKDYGTDKDKTVYYNMDGEMQYGQQKINGNWYCFSLDNGAMMTGLTNLSTRYQKNGAKTVLYGSDGVMCYGEHQVGNDWLYFDTFDGSLTRNKEVTVLDSKSNGGKTSTYYYGSDGRKIHGEKQTAPGIWKLYDLKTGARKEGFVNLTKAEYGTDEDKTVYYNEKGEMQYGQQKIGGYWYCFEFENGKMVANRLFNLTSRYEKSGPKTVYYDGKGHMYYGELELKEGNTVRIYTFDDVTGAKQDGTIRKEIRNGKEGYIYYGSRGLQDTGQKHLNGKWYYFDPNNNGFAATGLFHLTKEMEPSGAKTVFYNDDGSMFYGQKQVQNHWRWFKPGSGAMAVNEFVFIPAAYNKDGSKTCYYDEKGWMKYGTLKIGKTEYTLDNYSGDVTKVVINGVPYLKQNDPQWARKLIGGYTMAGTGCVPTAMTMIVNALTGSNRSPYDMAVDLHNHGYTNGAVTGTISAAHTYVGQKFNLSVSALTSAEMVADFLKKGGMIVGAMNPGTFVEAPYTHAVVIFGYNNGMANVYDPLYSEHNGIYSVPQLWGERSTDAYDQYRGSSLVGYMKM